MIMTRKHPLLWISLDRRNGLCSVCGPVVVYRSCSNRIGPTGQEYYSCSTPRKEDARKFRQRHDFKQWDRQNKLKYKFGLSLEAYAELLSGQHGRCAICGALPKSRPLAVDHDHHTGRIRGLLCDRCNGGIGMLGDDIEILRRAIEYLAITESEYE